ncbi:hypothetical protein BDV27DRAFT_153643 [Aspergillus caelatus]|uniref:Uncharacterized protein n=1 Tax=Aspergillus caelatus TaxID=61420 RepID=A0A5N7AII8_9EURO|nr:uncharacterized protein BDV27DRAFT_153643 [Aspergillus caelatus]KAE8368819.1 hypothetical protein BDV27DRAFT_153643 [Aspergillus caelatus]
MVVNWKNHESTDRLIGSLLAAHPDLKLDYHAMAVIFGQGATYDSIEGRFRRYRKIADELRDEAHGRGISDIPRNAGRSYTSGKSATSTPRTPRGRRGGITKSTPSSSRGRNYRQTPTKQNTKPGTSVINAIYVNDVDTEEEESKVKPEIHDIPSDSGEEDVKIVDSPSINSIKIKKERAGHNMAGLFSAMTPKKEEETSDFVTSPVSTRTSDIEGHDDDDDKEARYHAGMTEDPFCMIGSYFKQEHGGNMDDIYHGEA